jgi:hypothetical protein
VRIPAVFKIYYSEDGKTCKTIERKAEQKLLFEIPDEIAGLMANLTWSERLGLSIIINYEACVEEIDSLKKAKPQGKGILDMIHF